MRLRQARRRIISGPDPGFLNRPRFQQAPERQIDDLNHPIHPKVLPGSSSTAGRFLRITDQEIPDFGRYSDRATKGLLGAIPVLNHHRDAVLAELILLTGRCNVSGASVFSDPISIPSHSTLSPVPRWYLFPVLS